MDIFAHGLWTHALFEITRRRRDKTAPRKAGDIWWPIFFGVAPDIASFGPMLFLALLGISGPTWRPGLRHLLGVPGYVYSTYDFTHSLIVFFLVFGLVWLTRRRPYLPLLGWLLHILIDIPSHSLAFFPTPFLWPLSDIRINGTSWGSPIFLAINYLALALIYGWLYLRPWLRARRRIDSGRRAD